MKNFLYKIFIIIMTATISVAEADCIDNCDNQRNAIEINTFINVAVGDLIKGFTKSNFLEEQIIKFEIKCKTNNKIRIYKIKDVGNKYIKITTEWRCGGITGLENFFPGDGIYTTENKKYFITMKIKKIEVKLNTPSGRYNFSPEIAVEFTNI